MHISKYKLDLQIYDLICTEDDLAGYKPNFYQQGRGWKCGGVGKVEEA